MKIDIEEILSRVPEYTEVHTVEEMDQRSFALAAEYPDAVELTELGRSKQGRPIYCMKIGSGSRTALLYGTPHPNEPIGTMMLDALSAILAEDGRIRQELDYTWYIVKSSDVDGMAMNEGWFKGPFTITNYQHHFFRPAFDQQVEWSFPMDYKNYRFDRPTPETQCLMKLIDTVKPDFIYALHNSGFGGCYWYLTDGEEALYQKLQAVPAKYDIGLNLGEPEVPYCESRSDAVYTMVGASDNYDYMETFMPDQPAETLMNGGACSVEYAGRDGRRVHSLVTEMPYFMDPRVSDTSLSDRSRREVVLKSCERAMEDFAFWKPVFDEVSAYMHPENQCYLAAKERSNMGNGITAKQNWAKSEPSMSKPATVCQVFDNLLSDRFYSNLSIVLLRRACEEELKRDDVPAKAKKVLENARETLYHKECENLEFLESRLSYTALPIRDLVKVQLECGLIYAEYVYGLAR